MALLLGLAFAPACVDTGRDPDNSLTGGQDQAVVRDLKMSMPPADLAMKPPQEDFATGPMCVTQCFTDGDCQNSCPAPSSGINCCDTSTNTCFVSQDQVCPMPQGGGGDGGSPY